MNSIVDAIARRLGRWPQRRATSRSAMVPPITEGNLQPHESAADDHGSVHENAAASDSEPSPLSVGMTRLIVEGWRFIPHSYGIVNEWQLLALGRRDDVAVKVVDLPLYGRRWQTRDGLFDPEDEQKLRALSIARPDERADVTLRIAFPFDFLPSRSRQTVVFGTAENQVIRRDQLPDQAAFERLQSAPPPGEVKVLTPSLWSAEGFYRAGFAPEQVLVVPHGVDVDMFHPMPDRRAEIRKKLAVAEGDFVFLSVGAMTGNKGMDLLLKAFAQVCRRYPHARLVLKGMDSLYKSRALLLKSVQLLTAGEQQSIVDRLSYFGGALSHRQMAVFYQAADAYVSPYRAEGFNMPVLEAAASGLPIICTRGGPTDDFVADTFARRIDSHKCSRRHNDQEIVRLEPNIDHLIAEMCSVLEEDAWRARASRHGPLHARANHTWEKVVGQLMTKLAC